MSALQTNLNIGNWRFFHELSESISTFSITQKLCSQGSVLHSALKMCLEHKIVFLALFDIFKNRFLTFRQDFNQEDVALGIFCTSGAQI